MPKFLQTARDKALVIFERERPFFTPGAMSMYVLALVAEAPVIIARYLLALLIVFAVLVIEGNIHGGTEWALVALIPTAWSAVALFNPTGGAWWWQTRAGGREPSKREQLAYQDAVELLQANSEKPLPLPAHWFVIDSSQPDAAVCGDALMVSRGLLETDHVAAVLAHELGHLGSPDARLTTALNRLIMFSTPFRAGAAAGRSRPQMELVPRLQYTPVRRRMYSILSRTSHRPCSGSCGSCSSSRCSRKAASDYGSPARSGDGTGESASTTPTNTPQAWVRRRSSRTSSKSTP